MKRKPLISCFLIIFSLFIYQVSIKAQTYITTFDNYWNGHLSSYNGNVLVQIGCGSNTLYTYQQGVYNANTNMQVQSLSKLVTSAIIMMLVEENKMALDNKVGQYITSWNGNGKQDITIRQLLAHTSGVVEESSYDDRGDLTLQQAVDLIATNTSLLFSPGTGFKYGSCAYKMAARVAEIVENKPWKQIFTERLKNVCGMPNAVYSPNNIDNPAAGRGLNCSLTEYSNFMKMMINYGVYNSTRIMDSVSIVTMEAENGRDGILTYGLGQWRDETNGAYKEFWHPGVSGCLEFYSRNKNYYGVILSASDFNTTFGINMDFRKLTQTDLPGNVCPGGSSSNPCDFSMSTSASSTSVSPGASVTLNGSCSGQCSGVSYSWSGNGISGTGNSVTFNAPSTVGTYTYTLTGTKSGCSNQTSNINITVNPPGGGGTTCVSYNDNCSGNSSEIASQTVTVSSSGSYEFKLTYRAHEVNPSSTGRIRINGGSWQNITLPYAAPNVYVQTTIGNFNLNSGNNTVELNMVNGHQCYRQLCVTGGSGGCSTPAAPSLSASPSTITTTGGSSTLTATGCSGGTIDWSDGLGSGTSKTVSPSATKTYTATCSIGGCTSAAASVTVNVNISGGGTPVCVGLNDNCSGNSSEITSTTVTVSSSGSYEFKLTYRAHEVSPSSTGRIRINGGSWQNITLPYAAPNVYVQTVIGNFNLNSGNNNVELNMVNGHQCYRQLCVQPAGSPAILGSIQPEQGLVINKSLSAYPNPAKGVFEISFYLDNGKKGTLIISDLQGKIVYRKNFIGVGVHREKINIDNKSSGTYFLQLIKGNEKETKKIYITR